MTDQMDFGGETSTEATPIGEILDSGSADVTERHQEAPLYDLKNERTRLREDSARVEKMRAEVEKYDNTRWGIDDESIAQESAAYNRAESDPDTDRWAKSIGDFTSKHGKNRFDELDAAAIHLTEAQKSEMYSFAISTADPIEAVANYLQKAGLVAPAFRQKSLQEALESKGKAPEQPELGMAAVNQRLSELSQREQAIALSERRTAMTASRMEFIGDFGKAQLLEMDNATSRFINSLHPSVAEQAAAQLGEAMRRPDAYHAAAELLSQWGVWSPAEQQAQQQRAPVMPSNLAGGRSVTPRRGPAWSGPTSLNDIFDRRVPSNG